MTGRSRALIRGERRTNSALTELLARVLALDGMLLQVGAEQGSALTLQEVPRIEVLKQPLFFHMQPQKLFVGAENHGVLRVDGSQGEETY